MPKIRTKLDRTMQLRILEDLSKRHPEFLESDTILSNIQTQNTTESGMQFISNLAYLEGHGLIEREPRLTSTKLDNFLNELGRPTGFDRPYPRSARITSRGLDFLTDDGGLSAILGTVTIKLHDDTIKDLIEAKIHGLDLAPKDKQRYLDQLRSLPAESTKHLALKLIDAGLSNAPAAWTAIKTALSAYL